MSVRRAACWLASLVCLSVPAALVGCKEPPLPPEEVSGAAGARAEASASASGPMFRSQVPAALEGAFQCGAEGKASFDVGAGSITAKQVLALEGDASNEARTVVANGLCQRNAAFLACLLKEREEGRPTSRTTFHLTVVDQAVSAVESGPSELRACLGTAWVGAPASAATKISFTYIPGVADRPHPDVRALDVKVPAGVSVDVVAAKLRAKNAVIRACYEMALREKRTLAGTLLVEQDLGKDGKAAKTRVKHGTLQHPSFEKCVEQRLVDLSFEPPKTGKGTLRYTLSFATR